MGRKNFNRRGNMSRRARKRRTVTQSIAANGKKGSRFDSAPKKGDHSVVSSLKKKYTGTEEFANEAPEVAEVSTEPVIAGPGSASKQKHASLRAAGLERAMKLKAALSALNLPEAVTAPKPTVTVAQSPIIPVEKQKTITPIIADKSKPVKKAVKKEVPLRSEKIRAKRRAREQRLKNKGAAATDSESEDTQTFEKPKFGEVIDRPSDRIAELGKALAAKFTPAVAAKLRNASYLIPSFNPCMSEDIKALVADFAHISHEEAERYLEASNWDPEQAVALALSAAPLETPLLPPRVIQPSWLKRIGDFFKSILRGCFGFLGLLIFGRPVRSFSERVAEQYPDRRRIIDQPLSTCMASGSVVVAILYLPENRDSVIEKIFGLESLGSILDRRTIWASNIESYEGLSLYRAIRGRAVPIVVAVKKTSEPGQMQVIAQLQGLESLEEGRLAAFFLAVQEEEDRVIADRQRRNVDRVLREEQDREYMAALARDKEEEDARIAKALLEMEKKAKVDARKQEAFAVISKLEEPDISDKENCRISVKLHDGSRIERRFMSTDPLEYIYFWLQCASLLPTHASKISTLDRLDTASFFVSTSFPSKRLSDMRATLAELGLHPNALLLLTVEDDLA